MTIRKTDNQTIIDAVAAMIVAMLDTSEDEVEMENSVIGLQPAVLFKCDMYDRMAWVSIHPGMLCPQAFLASSEDCEYIDAPSEGFDSSEDAPQIHSPRFQRENGETGVRGYNFTHESFADAVSEAAKTVVRWLMSGDRG